MNTSSSLTIGNTKRGLTVAVPKGASCSLHQGLPSSVNYAKAIDPQNAIAPTDVSSTDTLSLYAYDSLAEGPYHYAVSMDGYTSFCQNLYCTAERLADGMRIDVVLNPLAGNGYESGYVMLNTPEFIKARLASDKDTWGAEYVHLFNTPWINRSPSAAGLHQQTTSEEMWAFIRKLAQACKYMHVFSLGKSPKHGIEMPLVLFTRENVRDKNLEQAAAAVRGNGKPTVQYTAQVHGNEPASAEGALAMMLSLAGELGKEVLDQVDVYIAPRINLDGALEVVRTSPTTGDDMNRDYLCVSNEELRMLIGAYNLFLPEVAIDGHEKLTNVRTADESRCTDMELQVGAGALNHPAVMTQTAMDMALTAIRRAQELDLRAHFYQSFASAAGGSAGSSYFGTRNSLSFLVETPGGLTLGRFCLERRVMAQYILASTLIRYAAQNAAKVMETVRAAREQVAKTGSIFDENELFVLEHEKGSTGSLPMQMIKVQTGELADVLDMSYDEHVAAKRTRPRPTAYVIPKGLVQEERIFEVVNTHAIPYHSLPEGCKLLLQQYIMGEQEATLLDEREVCFEHGAWVFPNTVPSAVLSVIMEPDFNSSAKRKMTLFSMGLLDADGDGALPLYRYRHDLTDGDVDFTL